METQTQSYWEAAKPYVQDFGSHNDQERYAAKVLPVRDLDGIVDRALWDCLSGGGFYVRRRLEPRAVEDLAVMRGKAQPGDEVKFETLESADELRGDQWDTLQRIKRKAPAGTEISTFLVVAYCGEFVMRKPYARLTQTVGGKRFKLDLCLD